MLGFDISNILMLFIPIFFVVGVWLGVFTMENKPGKTVLGGLGDIAARIIGFAFGVGVVVSIYFALTSDSLLLIAAFILPLILAILLTRQYFRMAKLFDRIFSYGPIVGGPTFKDVAGGSKSESAFTRTVRDMVPAQRYFFAWGKDKLVFPEDKQQVFLEALKGKFGDTEGEAIFARCKRAGFNKLNAIVAKKKLASKGFVKRLVNFINSAHGSRLASEFGRFFWMTFFALIWFALVPMPDFIGFTWIGGMAIEITFISLAMGIMYFALGVIAILVFGMILDRVLYSARNSEYLSLASRYDAISDRLDWVKRSKIDALLEQAALHMDTQAYRGAGQSLSEIRRILDGLGFAPTDSTVEVSQDTDPAKPRLGFDEDDVIDEVSALVNMGALSNTAQWQVITEYTPWVKAVLDYYQITNKLQHENRLRASIKAGRLRAGPLATAYGANLDDYTLIANNDNPDLTATLIHENHGGSHRENEQAELRYAEYIANQSKTDTATDTKIHHFEWLELKR